MHPHADSIAAICVASAWCDGQVTDLEKQALERIFVRLGYPRSEIMRRIGEAVEGGPSGESIAIPEGRTSQEEYMQFALTVCLADGPLSSHKVKFLAKLANFLSIPTGMLEALRQQAERLLRPQEAPSPDTAPARLETLLPQQRIALGAEAIPSPSRRDVGAEVRVRKPLSELLYQGKDYGEEISLT
jgi:hypothetical protein